MDDLITTLSDKAWEIFLSIVGMISIAGMVKLMKARWKRIEAAQQRERQNHREDLIEEKDMLIHQVEVDNLKIDLLQKQNLELEKEVMRLKTLLEQSNKK